MQQPRFSEANSSCGLRPFAAVHTQRVGGARRLPGKLTMRTGDSGAMSPRTDGDPRFGVEAGPEVGERLPPTKVQSAACSRYPGGL